MSLKTDLTQADWKIVKAIPKSIAIKEIAEKSNLSRPYVSLRLQKLKDEYRIQASFKPLLKKLGLKPVVAIYRSSQSLLDFLKKNPPYVRSVSRIIKSTLDGLIVYGYVPEKYVDEYLDLIPEDPVKTYIGERIVKWRPDLSKATHYHRKKITVDWKAANEQAKSAVYEEEDLSRVPIDSIDMFIIREKEKWAYTPLTQISEIIEATWRSEKIKKKASPQLLEYHWKKHILKIWDFNEVRIFFPIEIAPIAFHYIRFKDDNALKAFLNAFSRNIIYNSTTIVLDERPAVFASIKMPCAEMIEFMKFVHNLGVEEYDLAGFMSPDTIIRYPIVYKMLKRGIWLPPKDLMELRQR